jgi:hypothetical protein
MNRRQRRMLDREYTKNKSKLIKNLKELNIPTEKDVEEYIMEKTGPKIIQPLTIINNHDDKIKEHYGMSL